MPHIRRNLFIFLASGLLAASAANAATVADQVGINIHFSEPRPGELEQLSAVGAGWVRSDLSWSATEKAAGVYDFNVNDRLLAALARQHLKLLLILGRGNPLYDDGAPPHSPAGRAAFAAWAAAAVTHFKGHGIRWEIWNEPNSHIFWPPAADIAAYVALADQATRAIHAATPDEAVVGPATSHIDLAFLAGVSRSGLLGQWSGVTVHPYRENAPPETVIDEYRRLRTMLRCWAPPGAVPPVLAGEWGFADVWKGFDVQRQASYLARMWLADIAEGIPLSIWYDWRDDGRNLTDPENHFGLVRWQYFPGGAEAFEPKPAYRAAQTLLQQVGGFTFSKRLAVGGPEDHVLLFTRGAEQRLAVWSRRVKPETLHLPLSAGAVQVVDLLGRVLLPLTTDGEGLALVPDGNVRYLTPPTGDDLLTIAAAWEQVPTEWVLPGGRPGIAALHLRNPLSRVIRIMPGDGTAGGLVAPGAEHIWRQSVTPSRDGEPVELRFMCAVEGLGTVAQIGMALAADPLSVGAAIAAGGISVRVESLSGSAFTGSVEIAGVTGSVRVPLVIPAGVRSTEVQAAVPNGPWTVRVVDVEGVLASERHLDPLPALAPAPGRWQVTVDGDAQVAAEATLLVAGSDLALTGQPALAMHYRTAAGARFARLAPVGAALALSGKPVALTMWVRCSGTATGFSMRFRDSVGQTFQPKSSTIAGDGSGWQCLSFRLDGIDTWRWGGSDDGVVHGAIHLDTLLLIDSARMAADTTVEIQAPAVCW